MILLLIILLKILLKEEFTVGYNNIEYNVEIPCSSVFKNKIIPEERSQSCELCCENYVKQQNWYNIESNHHGWKPNSFWNNNWYQIEKKDYKTGDKYYWLMCSCNAER